MRAYYPYTVEIFTDESKWKLATRTRSKSSDNAMAQFFRGSRAHLPNFTAVRAYCDPLGGVK